MGKEAIRYWAKEKEAKKTEEYLETNSNIKKKNKGKKKIIGIQHSEK